MNLRILNNCIIYDKAKPLYYIKDGQKFMGFSYTATYEVNKGKICKFGETPFIIDLTDEDFKRFLVIPI